MDNNIINKRTKGEWFLEENNFFGNRKRVNVYDVTRSGDIEDVTTILVIEGYTDNKDEFEANAAFIVKAVNNYDSLLDALKEINGLCADYSCVENGKINVGHISKISIKAIQKAEQ